MKKVVYTLTLALLATCSLRAQNADIVVSPDSVYVQDDVTTTEISLTSYIVNNTSSNVTIRWTRVVEQKPQPWQSAFCDKNLCYIEAVSSEVFELVPGESGLLKPIFYINHTSGIGVMRLYYASETPGIVWADTAVYVAVAGTPVGTVETEQVRSLALYPNPAQNLLHVVTANDALRGKWQITDSAGRFWMLVQPTTGSALDQIDISELPAGCYFLHALSETNQRLTSKPFVKQY